ncbi:hypothetical protein [Streptomyces sp. NPDC051677]|uniref:hypothetical protein n=1 Tax=Streptomyces sp. NPDC051677 TaxID=3365669 RepID=UPI0037D35A70
MKLVDLEARRLLLESAGLSILDPAWSGQAPTPMAAWLPIISGSATPTARVRIQEEGRHLPEVEGKWRDIAESSALFGERGEFLISVAGKGAATAPWALVRRTPEMALAQRIASVGGEPEFVAMSVDGRVVCGVTPEEYDVWIVAELMDQPR